MGIAGFISSTVGLSISASEALDQELHDWLTQTPDDVRISAVENLESSVGFVFGGLGLARV